MPSDSAPHPAWTRAALDLAIAAVLTEGDRHGYALAQRLTELGIGPVRGGTLYPVLNRLETGGYIDAVWQAGEGGPGRKVYSLTVSGRQKLALDHRLWQRFSASLDGMLDTLIGEVQ